MRFPSSTSRPAPRSGLEATRPAFSLIELIVVLAVIGLLLALLIPAVRGFRRNAVMAKEMGLARQLMVAYRGYAYDHEGRVMPGYDPAGILGLEVTGPKGEDLSGEAGVIKGSYVWRLAPWLDYNLDGLYADEVLVERLVSDEFQDYLPAVYPALGLNTFFVGGDGDEGFAFDPQYTSSLGRFYVTRVSEVNKPGKLLTFASARVSGEAAEYVDPGRDVIEGNFRVVPPRFTEVLQSGWAGNSYVPDCQSAGCDESVARSFGFLSLRHPGRTAVVGFFDGHTDAAGSVGIDGLAPSPDGEDPLQRLEENDLVDMRLWSHQATTPDWEVPAQGP